jgi:hypothetical protein
MLNNIIEMDARCSIDDWYEVKALSIIICFIAPQTYQSLVDLLADQT